MPNTTKLQDHSSDLLEDLQWRQHATGNAGVDSNEVMSEEELLVVSERLEKSLKIIGTLRNSFRSINRLRPSTLARIFSFLQMDDSSPPPEDTRPNAWILVAHVCSHWSCVARQTPSLWRTIRTTSNVEHIKTFLENSSSAPLRVVFSSSSCSSDNFSSFSETFAAQGRALRLVAENMSRVEEISFSSSFPIEMFARKDILSQVMSSSLSLRKRGPETPPSNSPKRMTSFSKLFSTPAPHLRRLSLRSQLVLQLSISQARYTTLTHLELYDQPRWKEYVSGHESEVVMEEFLDILEASSNSLQVLTLVRAGPRAQKQDSQDIRTRYASEHRVIHLPSLLSIEIGDWPASGHVAYFLAHLRIPGTAKRCIWGDTRGDNQLKYLSSILFPLDTELSAMNRPRGWDCDVRRVVLASALPVGDDAAAGASAGLGTVEMVGFRSENHTVYIQGGNLDFATLYPLFRDQSQIFSDHVEELCLLPTCTGLIPSYEEYQILFETMANIRRLVVRDVDLAVIFQSLGLFMTQDELTSGGGIPLPLLEDLDIRYDEVDALTHNAFGKQYTTSPLSMLVGISKLARQRKKIGRPLRRVRLHIGARRDNTDIRTVSVAIKEQITAAVTEVFDLTLIAEPGSNVNQQVAEMVDGMWPSRGYIATMN